MKRIKKFLLLMIAIITMVGVYLSNQFDVSVNADQTSFMELVDFLNGVYVEDTTTSNIDYKVSASGNTITLLADISQDTEVSQTITIGASDVITLDLNGHVLNLANNGSYLFSVEGQLEIYDSSDKSSVHYFNELANGLWQYTTDVTENVVNGGVITGITCTSNCKGAFANVVDSGVLTIDNINFVGNEIDIENTAACFISSSSNDGVINVVESNISHNIINIDSTAAGIYILGGIFKTKGYLSIDSCIIEGNDLDVDGDSTYFEGGIIYSEGDVLIKDSTIYAPSKVMCGGVIYAGLDNSYGDAAVSIFGDSHLYGNTYADNINSKGGIICTNNSSSNSLLLVVTDYTILDNGKSYNGGAIYATHTSVNISGNAQIINCTAEVDAAICSYTTKDDITLEICDNAIIEYNEASQYIVTATGLSSVKIYGATSISNNTANDYGIIIFRNCIDIDIYGNTLINGNDAGSGYTLEANGNDDSNDYTIDIYGNTKITNNTYDMFSLIYFGYYLTCNIYGYTEISNNAGTANASIIESMSPLNIYGSAKIIKNKYTKYGIDVITKPLSIAGDVVISENVHNTSVANDEESQLIYVNNSTLTISDNVQITKNESRGIIIYLMQTVLDIDGTDVSISENSSKYGTIYFHSPGSSDNNITGTVLFDGNTITGPSSAVLNNVYSVVNISGDVTISNTTSNSTGAIYSNGGTYNIDGIVIKDNSGTHGAIDSLGFSDYNSNFTIRNSTITGNHSSQYGAIYIESYSNFYVYDSIISENVGVNAGAIFSTDSNLTTYFYNTEISKNRSGGSGGAIYAEFANMYFYDCDIYGNKANGNGGAFYTYNIYDTYHTLAFENCNIYDNLTNASGAGIYLQGKYNILLGGSTKIYDNYFATVSGDTFTKTDTASNLYMYNNTKIDFGTKTDDVDGNNIAVPTSQMLIHLYCNHTYNNVDIVLSEVPCEDYYDYFIYDGSNFIFSLNNSKYLVIFKHTHDGYSFDEWTSSTTLPTSGNYFLSCDVTISEKITINGSVHLCLNGHDIINNCSGACIELGNYANLYIFDCGTNVRKGKIDENGLFVFDATGDIEITGGALRGSNHLENDNLPSLIYLTHGSLLSLEGGNIVGNYSKYTTQILATDEANLYFRTVNAYGNVGYNGGVFASTNGTSAYLNSGTFAYNTANNNGGVAYLYRAGKLYNSAISGKDLIVSYNHAKNNGGAIYAYQDLTGGTYSSYCYVTFNNTTASNHYIFEYNTADNYGGAMCFDSYSYVNLTNIELYHNESGLCGGAIAVMDTIRFTKGYSRMSYLYLYSTTITENISGVEENSFGAGGGIYVRTSKVNIDGKSLIYNNSSSDVTGRGTDIYNALYIDDDGYIYDENIIYTAEPTTDKVTHYYFDMLDEDYHHLNPTLEDYDDMKLIKIPAHIDIYKNIAYDGTDYKFIKCSYSDLYVALGAIHPVYYRMDGTSPYQAETPDFNITWSLDDSGYVFVGWYDDPLGGNLCNDFIDSHKYYARWRQSNDPDSNYVLTSGFYVTSFGIYTSFDDIEYCGVSILESLYQRLESTGDDKITEEDLTFGLVATLFDDLDLPGYPLDFSQYGITLDTHTKTLTFDNVCACISNYVPDNSIGLPAVISTFYFYEYMYFSDVLSGYDLQDKLEAKTSELFGLNIELIGENNFTCLQAGSEVMFVCNGDGDINFVGLDKNEDTLNIDLSNNDSCTVEAILAAYVMETEHADISMENVTVTIDACPCMAEGYLVIANNLTITDSDFTLICEDGYAYPVTNIFMPTDNDIITIGGNSVVTLDGTKLDDIGIGLFYYSGDITIQDDAKLIIYGSTIEEDCDGIGLCIPNMGVDAKTILVKDNGLLECHGDIYIADLDGDDIESAAILDVTDSGLVIIDGDLLGLLSDEFIASDHIVFGATDNESLDEFLTQLASYQPIVIGLNPQINVDDLTIDDYVYGVADDQEAFEIATISCNQYLDLIIEWLVDDVYTTTCPDGISYEYDSDTGILSIITTDETNAGTYEFRISNNVSKQVKDPSDENKMVDYPFYKHVDKSITVNKAKVTKPQADSTTYNYTGYEITYNMSSSTTYTVANNKKTNADTYTVTVSLNDKDNYEWADGTTTDLEFDFVINKAKITKPQSDTNEYQYNGSEITYYIPQNNAYIVTNNKKTNAGSYTVTVALSDKSNYEWADATNTDLSYTFVISKGKVNKPIADNTDYYYNENEITYNISDNIRYTISNDTHVDAGSYIVTVSLNDKANYEWNDATSADLQFTFVINKAKVTKPQEDTTTYTYNGNDQYYGVTECSEYSVTNGTQKDAGSYTVTVTLTDTNNYIWEDDTTANLTYTFVIAKAKVDKPSEDNKKYTYSGKKLTYTVIPNNAYTITGNEQTNAGSYTVTIALNDKANYEWADATNADINYTFVINKAKVTKPNGDTLDYVYTGTSQTYYIPESTLYTVSNNSQTLVGSYTVVVALSDLANYTWDDETSENLNYTFVINKAKVSKPLEDPITYVYNGEVQTYNIPTNALYTVTNNSQTLAGSYDVTIALTDTDNYTWTDGTSTNLTYTFVIAKAKVAKPTQDTKDYVYTGSELTYNVAESNLYTVSGTKATLAGSYTVTIVLSDKANYEWNDATNADLNYAFVIGKAKVAKPAQDTKDYVYTGSELTYNVAESNLYTVSGTKATLAGSYIVTIVLSDKANYEWNDNTNDDLSYQFVIGKAKVNKPTEDSTNYVYTGSELTYAIEANNNYTVTGTKQTNVGTYKVIVKLNDKDNYCWIDSTNTDLEFNFVIKKATNEITELTIDNFIEGETPSVPVANALFGLIEYMYSRKDLISFGPTAPTEPGNYIIRAYVEGTDNYEFCQLEKEYVIYQNKSNIIVDEEGSEVEEPSVVITDATNGLDPNAVLVIKVIEQNDEETINNINNILDENNLVGDKEEIKFIYDAKLLVGEEIVEPNGAITIKMQVPENVRGKAFKLYHIHTNEDGTKVVSEITFGEISEDFYITFTIDKLSEFAFVGAKENNGFIHFFLIAVFVIGAGLCVYFYFVKKNIMASLITSGAALLVSIVLTIFSCCTLCVVMAIIDIVGFLGFGAFMAYLKFIKK